MRDPERLLDHGNGLERKLLSSMLDEPLPPELMPSLLAAAGIAEGSAVAGTAGALEGAAAAKTAGSGILGAAALGALAGLLTVGAFQITSSRHDPPPGLRPGAAWAATALASTPGPETVVAPAPFATPVAPETHVAERPLRASRSSSSPRISALAAEIEQLDEARSALREGDPARALALLDRYARATPHGQMAREAAVLRAEAEAALKKNP